MQLLKCLKPKHRQVEKDILLWLLHSRSISLFEFFLGTLVLCKQMYIFKVFNVKAMVKFFALVLWSFQTKVFLTCQVFELQKI